MPAVVIEDRGLLNFTTTATLSGGAAGSSNPASTASLTIPFAIEAPDVQDLWLNQQFIYQQSQLLYGGGGGGLIENDDNFGSPMPFDASENGLWNGRFVPPPPRPPYLDDSVIEDGVTTCDLCSWAMPTKNTFIFEGTIEKATELGWPLTLIIVSVISAILGAILMVTIVRCKRKKQTNRNEIHQHVQWWSRNKRTNSSSSSNSQLRRNNIYTAHPADSIRGLSQHQQQQLNNHHQHSHQNGSSSTSNNNSNMTTSATLAGSDSCSWSNVTGIVVTS